MRRIGVDKKPSREFLSVATKDRPYCTAPTVVVVVTALAILLLPMTLWADSCTAPKPAKVFGAMRGVVIDPSGAPVPDTDLFFASETGTSKMEVHADAKGEFRIRFSSLPHGIYRMATNKLGCREYVGEVKVTRWKPEICQRSLLVEIATTSCMGGISRGRAPCR